MAKLSFTRHPVATLRQFSKLLRRHYKGYWSFVARIPCYLRLSYTRYAHGKRISLEKLSELHNPSLVSYLVDTRKINIDIARTYCEQITFSRQGNSQHQDIIAWPNREGDFEIKNAKDGTQKFSACIASKKNEVATISISLINIKNRNKVAIFESMIDFLSYLTHHQIMDYQSSAIILNSVYLKDDALQVLQATAFEKAYFYLDDDETGQKCFAELSAILNFHKLINQHHMKNLKTLMNGTYKTP
jgi:hypothetical protein